MQEFIEATIQQLRTGQFEAETLRKSLSQLSEELETVEARYTTAPEEEEELRQALLRGIRLYQLALELLGRYLQQPRDELLERAWTATQDAALQLDDVECNCVETGDCAESG